MFEAPRQFGSAAAAAVGSGEIAGGSPPFAAIDVHKILSLVWRGRATILWTTAFSLLMAGVLVLAVPPSYTAVTQILIDPTDLHAVANAPVPPNQSDAAVLQVESQVRVLTSDSVLRRVVRAEKLDRDPEFAGSRSPMRRLLAFIQLDGRTSAAADPSLAALVALKRSVTVQRAERTYVVTVSVTSRNAEKAARLANAVAAAYLADQTAVRFDAARQVSQSLSARLHELKNRVREAEDRVEAFKAHNNIVDVNGESVNEQQLSELNNQLVLARARTAQARARYDEVQRLQQTKGEVGAFPAAVQSPTMTALRTQYAEIMRREAEQMSSLGARHPAVIDIEAQVERLKGMIADEIKRLALSTHSEYGSARANEDTLARNLDALKRKTIATNEALVRLRELQRDAQASRTVYDAFLVRARETGEQGRIDTKNIRVISSADLPLHRSFPPSNLKLALGAIILGAAAGIGLVVLRAPDGEAAPSSGSESPGRPRRRSRNASGESKPFAASSPAVPAVPVLAVLPDIDAAFGLEAAMEPKSPFAREIGKVHAAVRAHHTKRNNPSILVVAPDDEDDTATVALGLAATAAATQRVLLIDADLERRTLSAVDADRGEAGLVDVAVGGRVLADAVIRDRESKINLLPLVSPHSRRHRELRDEDIEVAFAQTKHFDMVIVAAMDCDRDPSGRFFAGLVDHIVLVATADAAARGVIERLVACFGLDGRKIRGAVLTGATAA